MSLTRGHFNDQKPLFLNTRSNHCAYYEYPPSINEREVHVISHKPDFGIVGVCNCSMFCCTLLFVHSSFAIILMGKRELVALLSLSSWCLVIVVVLFLGGAMGLSAVCDCGIS